MSEIANKAEKTTVEAAADETALPTAGTKIHVIVKYPDPILATPGETVTAFTDELAEFVEEMWASMYAAQGIGLAAPQIGVSKRITVIDANFKEKPEERLVLINPEIVKSEGKVIGEEGCLSLPEIRDKVKRAARVKVRAQNLKGEFFEVEGTELRGRAMQHEIDHLNGILFIDRLSPLKRDLAKRRIRKLQQSGQW